MEPFRSARGKGARASLAPAEASLLRSLVSQVIALIAPDAPVAFTDQDGVLARLDAELTGQGDDQAQTPDDPVLARLLPDAYRDDPDASGEFRRYTEQGLRSGKIAAARTVLATLPQGG